MPSLFGQPPGRSENKLASLFTSSTRPVKHSGEGKQRRRGDASKHSNSSLAGQKSASEDDDGSADGDDEVLSSLDSDERSSDASSEGSEEADQSIDLGSRGPMRKSVQDASPRAADEAVAAAKLQIDGDSKPKRKRKRDDDDLEGAYMQRLAREEAKEDELRTNKKQKNGISSDADQPLSTSGVTVAEPGIGEDASEDEPPQHETLTGDGSSDLEKAARTVFLGNVATSAITSKTDLKILKTHLGSFLKDLPQSDPLHKLESLRFRSTAYAGVVPKKAAFARQELMDSTTHCTNAYAVYSTKPAAREAAKQLNGTIVLNRHLRVDEVAHPAKADHRRCVFVGNLNFVDDETQMKQNEAIEGNKKPSKARNGDVEEGLWRQFGKAGTVESVRVVRDPKTRVSKGIAYVQFTNENAVEEALLFNEKKYPPLLPRKLRVVRAKKFKKTQNQTSDPLTASRDRPARATPRVKPEQQSANGRAKKLLGRAGAATMSDGKSAANGSGIRKPESFVFEGHRATSAQGNTGLKLGRSGKKKGGKPTDRGAKRAAAWKKEGGSAGKK